MDSNKDGSIDLEELRQALKLAGNSKNPIRKPGPKTRVGFEILQMVSMKEIVVWVNTDMSAEEFEAIELPAGWFKNQPREPDPDSGQFLRSPKGSADGPLVEREHFGHSWRQNATVVEVGIKMDQQGLLTASRVAKHHVVTYKAGRKVKILVSPEGDQYIRVSRDANRDNDIPTLPATWRIIEKPLGRELTFQLPNPTLVVRADNQDSFQGPIPPEVLGPVGSRD